MVPFWPTTLSAGRLDEGFLDQTPFNALGFGGLASPAAAATSGRDLLAALGASAACPALASTFTLLFGHERLLSERYIPVY